MATRSGKRLRKLVRPRRKGSTFSWRVRGASLTVTPRALSGGAMPNRYDEVYARSIRQPEEFWAEAAEDVRWFKRWERVLDRTRAPFYQWFVGGVTNTCYNALDIHI